MKLFDIEGKIVAIAGATGLIGKALSEAFAQMGAIVILASRTAEKGIELEQKIKSQGGKAIFHSLDIAVPESVDEIVSFIVDKYGKIDVWINNAWPRTSDWMKKFEEVSIESIRQNMEMHLEGYFICCQKVCPVMKQAGGGNVINFSSIYGVVAPNFSVYQGTPMTCPPAYPLIKGGIVAMTKYLSTYYAKDNIRVNCLCPGGIFDHQHPEFVKRYVERTPMKRMGTPEDIVGPTVFLASKASSYITGQVLIVDGGLTVW